MAMQTLAGSQVQGSLVQGSQVGLGNVGSTGKPCWRCIKHQVQCIVVTNRAGAQCENCWVKHYRCLLVLLKEVMEAKVDCRGPSRQATVGSQMKGWARKA